METWQGTISDFLKSGEDLESEFMPPVFLLEALASFSFPKIIFQCRIFASQTWLLCSLAYPRDIRCLFPLWGFTQRISQHKTLGITQLSSLSLIFQVRKWKPGERS